MQQELLPLPKAAIDAALAFLDKICGPAAQEFGYLLQDKVRFWRLKNLVRILQKAHERFPELLSGPDRTVEPRIAYRILEHGSWSDTDTLQDKWAGLLAASCSHGSKDDGNLIFINLLAQLTIPEVRLIDHICSKSRKLMAPSGSLTALTEHFVVEQLREIMGIDDFHRIDRELDHLHSLGLINGGFSVRYTSCEVGATTLALQMFARCKGFLGNPNEFFGISDS